MDPKVNTMSRNQTEDLVTAGNENFPVQIHALPMDTVNYCYCAMLKLTHSVVTYSDGCKNTNFLRLNG